MVTFDAATKRILDGKHFATVATTRQKGRNLARDPRLRFGVFDPARPYDYVEIRGRVELTEDPDKRLSKFLSQKYMTEDPPAEPDAVIRLVVRVIPEKVVHFAA